MLCSTVSAMYAQSVAAELQKRGRDDILFIDSPVSGGAKRAADGTLSIMAGASDEALQAGRDILQEMSDENKLYLVPGGIGAGSNMKMVHQVLAAIHILGASEAMGFAAQLGLDARATAQKIQTSDAWTWMHENRFPRMVEEDWNPGASALTIILKDAVRFYLPRSRSIHSAANQFVTGNHHRDCPPTQLPHPSLLDRRTNIPFCASTRLGPQGRLGHGPTVLCQAPFGRYPMRRHRSRHRTCFGFHAGRQSCRGRRGRFVCALSQC